MAEFVLHVPDIDEAGRDYAFELSPAWMDSHLRDAIMRHDPAFGPGAVEVHAQDNGGGEYLVTGTVRAHLLTECGRCLGDAKLAVDTQVATLFARTAARPSTAAHERHGRRERHPGPLGHPGHSGHGRHEGQYERHKGDAGDSGDDLDDDLPREEFSGNDIPLDELIREHIVLEVPMQPLCSEQCQGIAIPEHLRPPADAFPGPDAVDPRLAPLRRLRDNVPPKTAQDAPSSGARTSPTPAPTAPPLKKSSNRQPKHKAKFKP